MGQRPSFQRLVGFIVFAFVCLGGLALGAGCVRENGKCLSPFQLASPLSASLAFDMLFFVGRKFGFQ